MSKEHFTLEIFSPEKVIFSGSFSHVIIPTLQGYMGIMPSHMPSLCVLTPGFISIIDKNITIKKYLIVEGFAEIFTQHVTLTVQSYMTVNNNQEEEAIQTLTASLKAQREETKSNHYREKLTKSLNQLHCLTS